MNKIPPASSNPAVNEGADAEQVRRWVEAARGGDENAFGELVKMYHQRLYGMVYGMIRQPEDARDLEQQIWIKAWNNLRLFRAEAGFFTWLYRIATNTTLDFLRQRARRREESLTLTGDDQRESERPLPAGEHWQPDRQAEQAEVRRLFDEALALLSPEHRLALMLREVEGLSYQEIGAAMKCRPGTVMSRIYYARKAIQEKMRACQ